MTISGFLQIHQRTFALIKSALPHFYHTGLVQSTILLLTFQKLSRTKQNVLMFIQTVVLFRATIKLLKVLRRIIIILFFLILVIKKLRSKYFMLHTNNMTHVTRPVDVAVTVTSPTFQTCTHCIRNITLQGNYSTIFIKIFPFFHFLPRFLVFLNSNAFRRILLKNHEIIKTTIA